MDNQIYLMNRYQKDPNTILLTVSCLVNRQQIPLLKPAYLRVHFTVGSVRTVRNKKLTNVRQ